MAITGNNLNYQPKLIAYAMDLRGWNEYEAAEQVGISFQTVNAGLAGTLGTIKKLRLLADGLGIVWKCLFDIDMPESEFHRAVSNGKRSR